MFPNISCMQSTLPAICAGRENNSIGRPQRYLQFQFHYRENSCSCLYSACNDIHWPCQKLLSLFGGPRCLWSGLWFSVSLSLSVWDLWLKLCLWWYQLNRIDDANIKQFVINAMYASTSWIFLNTQKQLRGQREKTMSTMVTQHASAVRMIWVMDSIPWVRCASGNVEYQNSYWPEEWK